MPVNFTYGTKACVQPHFGQQFLIELAQLLQQAIYVMQVFSSLKWTD